MSQIGKNIKKIRNVRGLSQQAFADLFKLTRGNISSYEEFRAEPKIEVMVKIANFFGIPLGDFIEKDLSVNELLHYNAELVIETEKLKIAQQLAKVPYVPVFCLQDFIKEYNNEEFIHNLPHIIIPSNSKFKLLAIEIENQEELPVGFNYRNGDVLVFENIVKENIHRVIGKLGMTVDEKGIHTGVYTAKDGNLFLALNDWVVYPFNMESDINFWVLKALYIQS